ncbi:hypothetical protein EYD45_02195 [Hyunsoonleella flava]|uniref:HTH LytTR-type domain-containing protein n=1 Tax=Hyunsoonleella flava TaxID=2527939 RepID=A0A4Q9FJB2_9FLAO|nr:LytTR family DNA-binding domain-containing protein [Hyunsoonleella flava]TBN06715.1 hypothetical protein EYD45_02195 [Hyunsoonleella flava]
MVRQYFTVIFVAIIFFTNKCISQNETVKRVKDETTLRQNDSVKVVELLNSANYYYQNEFNLDSLLAISTRAVIISKKSNLDLLTSRGYSAQSITHLHRGTLDDAKIALDSSYLYAKKSKNDKQIISSLTLISGYHTEAKQFDKAVEILIDILKIADKDNDIATQASVYNRLTNLYSKQNNEPKVKENLDKLSQIIKNHPNKVPKNVQIYVLESYVYYFEKRSKREPNSKALQDSVKYYYNKGLDYAKTNKLLQNQGSLHAVMASLYINKDQFLEAEPYIKKALQYKNYLDNIALNNIYGSLPHISLYKNHDIEAKKYVDTLLYHVPKYSTNDSIHAYHIAYEINFALRNYKESQKYSALEKQLKDKQEAIKQAKIVEELQLKYDTEKKDALIKAQTLEQKELKNRARINYLLFGLGFLGLLVFVVGYYFLTKNKSLAVKLDLEQTKAALLQSKLNPNFQPKENGNNVNGNGKTVDKLLVKSQDISELVNINDIIRCEADGTYAKIVTTKKTLFSSKNLKYHEDILTKHNFIRVHNSHLVNVDYIQSFNRQIQDGMQLHNGDKIPVSARKKKEISEFLDTLS